MVHIMRVCLKEKLDDTRGVTRIRKSNRDSQNNEWPKKKVKRKNNDLHNPTQKRID